MDTPAATTSQPVTLRIDFVSDVACPWCAIGLASLQQALHNLHPGVRADIQLQPFELNPDLPLAGESADAHLMHKYGIDGEHLEANRKAIRERAASVGVDINTGRDSRVWNTFDAHRLLHWAALVDRGRALELKRALFRAYFTDNENVADRAVLLRIAVGVGLDANTAQQVLENNQYAAEVRAQELRFQQAGIHSVPATIVNETSLIPGGQPPEVFEHVLRTIAAEMATG